MMNRVDGYRYEYDTKVANKSDLNLEIVDLYGGDRNFVFQIRTQFTLQAKDDGEITVIDSEKFDVQFSPTGNERSDIAKFFYVTYYRLLDYWMTLSELNSFLKHNMQYANTEAGNKQESYFIVNFECRTVQQDDETLEATKDRAIMAKKLVPIYLWAQQPKPHHVRNLSFTFWNFLAKIQRTRVTDVSRALTQMSVCIICKQQPHVGDQISNLPCCNHAFHTHCITTTLITRKICPACDGPPCEHYILADDDFNLPIIELNDDDGKSSCDAPVCHYGTGDDGAKTMIIDLPGFKPETVDLVVKYLKTGSDAIANADLKMLRDVAKAANVLKIPTLLDESTAMIAEKLKTCTIDEMREGLSRSMHTNNTPS